MATPAAEAELKQQGAFEAARDPKSSVTAADAEAKALTESKKAGVPAFTFNPNATPEEKAAQAKAVSFVQVLRSQKIIVANLECVNQNVPEGFHHEKKPLGVAVVTDIDTGKPGAYNLPEATKAGAIAIPKDKDGKPLPKGANGVMDKDEKERWEDRTGWAPRFGTGVSADEAHHGESMLDHQTWVEGQLSDKFYGGKS